MARTESKMLALGTRAPDFTLPDTISEKNLTLNELTSDKATVVMFICNHCPFVIHIIDHLVETIKEYQDKGIAFIAISANDIVNYPADAPDKMQAFAKEKNFSFPYLYDETQEVAKAYDAACTPDFYLFDNQLNCVYRGRYDGASPGNNVPVTGEELTSALDAILNNEAIDENQKPSIGCNIKWKE